MAKSKDGLLGKLSGKIGDVVISSWKGIPYIRSKPAKNTSNTKAQQIQRSKFGIAVKFIGRILPVINKGFKWNIEDKTERNAAISYVIKNAIEGEDLDLRINYAAVLIARGNLPAPQGASAKRADNTIVFRWDNENCTDSNRKTDRVIVLAYAPELKAGEWSIGAASRSEGKLELELSPEFSDAVLHCYLAFADIEGNDASDSVYLGEV